MMVDSVSKLVDNVISISERMKYNGNMESVWKDSEMEHWECATEFKQDLIEDDGWVEIKEWNEKDEYRIWIQVRKNRILEHYAGIIRVTEFRDFNTLIILLYEMID